MKLKTHPKLLAEQIAFCGFSARELIFAFSKQGTVFKAAPATGLFFKKYKAMKMNLIILMVTSLFLNQACVDKEDNCHKTITFKNTTTDTLYVVSSSQYPDTSTFVGIPNPVLDPNFTKVLPGESNTQVLWGRDCIEFAFKDLIPSDTMMIYVFDAKVLEGNTWDTVKANYLVLKRYDLSLDDLKQNNWTITYP